MYISLESLTYKLYYDDLMDFYLEDKTDDAKIHISDEPNKLKELHKIIGDFIKINEKEIDL